MHVELFEMRPTMIFASGNFTDPDYEQLMVDTGLAEIFKDPKAHLIQWAYDLQEHLERAIVYLDELVDRYEENMEAYHSEFPVAADFYFMIESLYTKCVNYPDTLVSIK